MKTKYKLRLANRNDISNIEQLIREYIAREKNLLQPELVKSRFVNEMVNQVVGDNMLIVENSDNEIELIGIIHNYSYGNGGKSYDMVELAFISRMHVDDKIWENDLVEWLYSEISKNRNDVFRVELNTSRSRNISYEKLRAKGIDVDARRGPKINNSAKNINGSVLPLSWFNPSFRETLPELVN